MGFDDRRIVLVGDGAPGSGSPAESVVEIVARILRPYARSIDLADAAGTAGVDLIESGAAHLGALNLSHLFSAYEATNHFAGRDPIDGLRVLANVSHPQWLVVAVRAELGSDLGELAAAGTALRLRVSDDPLAALLLEHYGLSAKTVEQRGGSLEPVGSASDLAEWVTSGEFDAIVATVHSGYSPESRAIEQASIAHELVFLPVPDEVARTAARAGVGEWANLPHHLLRGVAHAVDSVSPHPIGLYGLDTMPDGFARLVAQALDENRAMLRQSHLALSYDTLSVGMSYGVPLHGGARRYYQAMHYPTGDAAEDHDHGEEEGHTHGHGGHHHDHGHDHGHSHGPDAWEDLGRGGSGAHRRADEEHQHGDRDHDAHSHEAHRHDEPAPARSWEGGFGRR